MNKAYQKKIKCNKLNYFFKVINSFSKRKEEHKKNNIVKYINGKIFELKNCFLIELKTIIIIFFFASTLTAKCQQDTIDNYIFKTVYKISFLNYKGTSFLFNYKEKCYLVTAKHLFCKNDNTFKECVASGNLVTINITSNDSSVTHHKKIYYHPKYPSLDIAVIDVGVNSMDVAGLDIHDLSLLKFGFEVYFLGFPYSYYNKTMNKFPAAFIKKAIISGWDADINRGMQFYLDGINNPGFSGGPVIIRNGKTFNVIGVIHSYASENYKIKNDSIPLNTGIINVGSAQHIEEIIESFSK